MSPGKAAYEQRKREKIERKLKMEKSAEEYRARQDKADKLSDLLMDAANAFFLGDAELLIEDAGNNARRVTFQFKIPR